jgi:hypothetical protein
LIDPASHADDGAQQPDARRGAVLGIAAAARTSEMIESGRM